MDIKIIRCLCGKKDHQFFEKDLESYHRECQTAKENDIQFGIRNQMVIVLGYSNIHRRAKSGEYILDNSKENNYKMYV
jgi:hypothetical protein